MERECDSCGATYTAIKASSRFCGTPCRVRWNRNAKRTGGAQVVPLSATGAATGTPSPQLGVAAALEAELREAGRLDTSLGRAAMVLAAKLESGKTTSPASVAKEFRATREAALLGAKNTKSGLERMRDELAARREGRGA